MNDTFTSHSSNVKLSGLGDSLDLDADKSDDRLKQSLELERKQEELRRKHAQRHFDPLYMETTLPDLPDTGNISFDPNDMTFNFK